jgi:hypothetical protein
MLSMVSVLLLAGAELPWGKALECFFNVLATASPGYFAAGVASCWCAHGVLLLVFTSRPIGVRRILVSLDRFGVPGIAQTSEFRA